MDKYSDKVDGIHMKMISEEDKFHFRDLLKFKAMFWLISASCILTYSAVFPFMQVITNMLEDKYCVSEN
jgi:hypothetical protein